MKSRVIEYSKDAVIFREGDPGCAAFIILEGCVEVSTGVEDRKTILAVLRPITVFGEMALISKERRRTATVIAKSFSKVAEITKRSFDEFIEQSPKLLGVVLGVLVDRLKNTTDRLSHRPDLMISMASALEMMARHCVRNVKFDPTLSMIEYESTVSSFSEMFGVMPEEIRKTLKTMETLNLIEIKRTNTYYYIDLVAKDDFVGRCRKIQATMTRIEDI